MSRPISSILLTRRHPSSPFALKAALYLRRWTATRFHSHVVAAASDRDSFPRNNQVAAAASPRPVRGTSARRKDAWAASSCVSKRPRCFVDPKTSVYLRRELVASEWTRLGRAISGRWQCHRRGRVAAPPRGAARIFRGRIGRSHRREKNNGAARGHCGVAAARVRKTAAASPRPNRFPRGFTVPGPELIFLLMIIDAVVLGREAGGFRRARFLGARSSARAVARVRVVVVVVVARRAARRDDLAARLGVHPHLPRGRVRAVRRSPPT